MSESTDDLAADRALVAAWRELIHARTLRGVMVYEGRTLADRLAARLEEVVTLRLQVQDAANATAFLERERVALRDRAHAAERELERLRAEVAASEGVGDTGAGRVE